MLALTETGDEERRGQPLYEASWLRSGPNHHHLRGTCDTYSDRNFWIPSRPSSVFSSRSIPFFPPEQNLLAAPPSISHRPTSRSPGRMPLAVRSPKRPGGSTIGAELGSQTGLWYIAVFILGFNSSTFHPGEKVENKQQKRDRMPSTLAIPLPGRTNTTNTYSTECCSVILRAMNGGGSAVQQRTPATFSLFA
ncbi:hypothetical protein V8C26DRAFT_62793 [Trichoderma gracile]